MKNKKILGMPLAIFIIGLMVLGGASAILVNYLSNTATLSQNVESPLSVQFAEVDHGNDVVTTIANVEAVSDWSDDLILSSSTGLSTVELGLKLENNADVNIEDEILALTISNSLGNVDCADLTSLTFIDVGASEGTSPYHVIQELTGIGLCTDNGASITFNVPINLLHPGSIYKYPVTLTYGNIAPAVYAFSATLMDI